MPFSLDQVVPWGRSFDEYVRMFALSEVDLGKRILGCADGPAAFNAELTRRGGKITSCDPLYHFGATEIEAHIGACFDTVLEQTRANQEGFVWSDAIPTVEALGDVRRRLEDLAAYPLGTWPFTIAEKVGCGLDISSQDTVPYCLWMAAAFLEDYPEAIWAAARVGGDVDTTCAIIGGIVALSVGDEGIPDQWRRYREPLGWSSSLG